jgi:hypothetical protein
MRNAKPGARAICGGVSDIANHEEHENAEKHEKGIGPEYPIQYYCSPINNIAQY